MSHELKPTWADRLKQLVPFGLGQRKPRHYRDMLRVAWENRDNLRYGWRVLRYGVCDGCALGVAGFRDWTMDDVHLCMTRLNLLRLNTMGPLDPDALADVSRLRGQSNRALRGMGRLAYPMRRRHGEAGFTRIPWEEAYRRIGERIAATDPSRLAFYMTSRGMTNEVYYVAQKVARYLGTNNIDNAARICHSPSTAGLKGSLGVAATTCSYRDWYEADLVVFIGANPANDQPVAMKYLDGAKKQGTKVALVNPYREPAMERYWVPSTPRSALFGTHIADWWFPVTVGGDVGFLYGTVKALIENDWYDRRFVEEHSEGFDALRQAAASLSWEDLEAQSGATRQAMVELAERLHAARSAVLVWSMGITQHAHGGDNVQMIVNLALLKGFVGHHGSGLMPIRGHSGVQGGAEMGAYATRFPGGRPVDATHAEEMRRHYGFGVPDRPGLSAPHMVEAAARGELDLLYCSGGNFVKTLPDPDYVRAAMANVPLRVHTDLVVTDPMLVEPAREDGEVILLPARTRYEQEGGGTQTSTERRVMYSPEIPREVGEAASEWRIYLNLAEAAYPGASATLGCQTNPAIREEIARVVPKYDGIQHLKSTGDAFQYGGRHLCAGWRFPTPDGKAHFRPVPLPTRRQEAGHFTVTTRRGKQFNSMIYGDVDPITDATRDAVLMNPDDAADLHVKDRDRVALVNAMGRFEGRIHTAPLARGSLQVHWPEGNCLVERMNLDPVGGVPDYNAEARVEVLEKA